MRRILTLLIAFGLLVAGAVAPVQAVDDGKGRLSDYGQQAVIDLAACLRTSTSLDVFYLIDNSSSLEESDPTEQRTGIIRQDIRRWGDIAGKQSGLTVRIAGSVFNSVTHPISGWQQVTQANADDVGRAFTKSINNRNLADYTNWLAALQEAKNQMISSTATCKAVIWFTDGGLWMPGTTSKDRNKSLDAVAALCGAGSQTGLPESASGSGIVAQLRTSGVHIFGILLHSGKDSEPNESYYRSLMQPIVEESGQVDASGSLPGGAMLCGENTPAADRKYAAGAFLQATSAADVAYSFLTIPSVVSGGTQAAMNCVGSGEFYVDPGIDSFEMATDASSWVVTNEKGSVVARSNAGFGTTGAYTTGHISVPHLAASEKWKFSPQGGSGRCQLYVYPELELVLHSKALISGKKGSVTGQFVKSALSGEKADLSKYKSVEFHAFVNKKDYPQAQLDAKTGAFTIRDYTPTQRDVENQVLFGASLKLATEHYDLFPINFEQQEAVYNPSALPSIGEIKFLKGITSSKDVAVASVSIAPPAVAGLASQICFDQYSVIADHQDESSGKATDRQNTWKWSSTGLNENGCIDILLGLNKPQIVTFKVSNPKQANAHVSALFEYRISSGELSGVKDSQTAGFETRIKTSSPLFWFWLLGLMFAGLAIPFLILSIQNHMSARLSQPKREQFAIFDFVYDAKQKTLTLFSKRNESLLRADGKADVLSLGAELSLDFSPSFRPVNGRSYGLQGPGGVTVSAKASLWPLNGAVYFVNQGLPENRIVSSASPNQLVIGSKLSSANVDALKYLHFTPSQVSGDILVGEAVVYVQPSADYALEGYQDAIRVLTANDALKESLSSFVESFKATPATQQANFAASFNAVDEAGGVKYDFDLFDSSGGQSSPQNLGQSQNDQPGESFDFKF